jgi:hypothetical protein
MFGPTVSPQLVQSGKGRIASNPALLYLPRPLMVGAFSVHGFNEQIFGANGQILGSGSERLKGVIRRLDPEALAFFGPGHP